MKTCEQCGVQFKQVKLGRARHYCFQCRPSKRIPGYVPPCRRTFCTLCGRPAQLGTGSRKYVICRSCMSGMAQSRAECPPCQTLWTPPQPHKPRLTPGDRGYGVQHRHLRKQWAAEVQAGVVDCWRCGERIPPDAQWDLGHDDVDRNIYRGPEHTYCNRATSTRRPPNQPAPLLRRRGSSHPRAARQCEMCGDSYRPTYHEQRTCGRACGVELQRRNRPAKQPAAAPRIAKVRPCQLCQAEMVQAPLAYCSDECRTEKNRRQARDNYRAKVGIPVDPTEPTSKWAQPNQPMLSIEVSTAA